MKIGPTSPRRSWSTASSTSATGTARSTRSVPLPGARAGRSRPATRSRTRWPIGRPRLLRLLRPPRLRAQRAHREALLAAAAQQRLGSRGTFYSTPAVAYGRVYIGSTDGKVYSFGATSGKLRWSHGTGDYVYSSPAVWRAARLRRLLRRHLYAFDAATGDVLWKFESNGPISGSPTIIDGVYFSTLKGRTYALDPRTGRQADLPRGTTRR